MEYLKSFYPNSEWQTASSNDELEKLVKDGQVEGGFEVESLTKYTYFVKNKGLHDSEQAVFDQALGYMYKQQAISEKGLDFNEIDAIYNMPIESNVNVLGKDSSEPSYYKFQFYTKTMQFTKEGELWEAIGKGSMSEIEQLKGKELLDTLEALRTILHPTVRALLESYIIDMVMAIPGIISFLLIGKSKQEIEPGTIMFRIRYLMEGCIDHEPTSLLKEYHIHLNAQPKEGQENPSIIQIILISKKLTTITIK